MYDCLKTKIYPLELWLDGSAVSSAENISRSRRAGSMPVMSKGWSEKSLQNFYLADFVLKSQLAQGGGKMRFNVLILISNIQ